MQYMVNYGSIDIPTPWTFTIMNPDYLEVFQTWNWNSNDMDSTGKATGLADQVPCSPMACGANQAARPGLCLMPKSLISTDYALLGSRCSSLNRPLHSLDPVCVTQLPECPCDALAFLTPL